MLQLSYSSEVVMSLGKYYRNRSPKALTLLAGSALDVTSTCSANLYDMSHRKPSRRAPNLK